MLVAGLWLAVVQKLPRGLNSIQKDLADCNLNIVSHFGYCYYILLVGGLFSLGGVSFNLLFARSAADRRRSVRHRFRLATIDSPYGPVRLIITMDVASHLCEVYVHCGQCSIAKSIIVEPH